MGLDLKIDLDGLSIYLDLKSQKAKIIRGKAVSVFDLAIFLRYFDPEWRLYARW